MSQPVVRVEKLSKKYRIGTYQNVDSLREQLAQTLRNLVKHQEVNTDEEENFIWALKDISFEVQAGEVLGIIGHNGAGKSTLLKILSRITRPTSGRIEIAGRVASLLEVGTGFHPELSGRENIYMNAAILGMRRKEIRRKFDEIVDFAGVEKFIDTPVKRYSSGMRVRLAFSVAAHLEPDILIVDEVLTVGDAAFQKKSLGKMNSVSEQGRTVLFVSHNLGALANLCPRAILLENGLQKMEGPSHAVINEYIKAGAVNEGERRWDNLKTAPGNNKIRLHKVRVISDGKATSEIDIQKDVRLEFELWNFKEGESFTFGIHLLDKLGVEVLASANLTSVTNSPDEWIERPFPVGIFRTSCTIPGNLLNEGMYAVNFIALTNITNIEFQEKHIISFNVYESGEMRKEFFGNWLGVVRPKLAWQTEHIGALEKSI
jgi:lipopolysaccharide transport system ATP-binding protein